MGNFRAGTECSYYSWWAMSHLISTGHLLYSTIMTAENIPDGKQEELEEGDEDVVADVVASGGSSR